MNVLEVPYVEQLFETSCGIAAFEMLYKYFRLDASFSQQEAFNALREQTPGDTSTRVTVPAIISLAREKGLHSGWGRVSIIRSEFVQQIRFFVENERVPLIACQQWHGNETLGHYRVIICIDDQEIAFHDPEPNTDGRARRVSLETFNSQWLWTPGGNVTGGVVIWIADRDISPPVGPDLPNAWAPVPNPKWKIPGYRVSDGRLVRLLHPAIGWLEYWIPQNEASELARWLDKSDLPNLE
jgi:hypothetical protein